MPIVGPRFPHARLQRPQAVFSPAAPTQQQQTIVRPQGFAAFARRLTESRRFPLQAAEPALTIRQGDQAVGINLVANGSFEINTAGWTGSGTINNFGRYYFPGATLDGAAGSYALGGDVAAASAFSQSVSPPINPGCWYSAQAWVYAVNGGSYQLLLITCDAGNTVISTSTATVTLAAGAWTPITLGRVTEVNAASMQIQVFNNTGLSAQRVYIDAVQLAPGSSIGPYVDTNSGALVITVQAVNGGIYRVIGVRPPAVINALPTQKAETIQSTLTLGLRRAVFPLLKAHWLLGGPTVLAQPPPIIPVATHTAGRTRLEMSRRRAVSFLRPAATLEPEAIALAERELRITLTRTRPRPTGKRLGKPTTLQTFAGPRVFLARTRPRPTTRRLSPPAAIRIPSVEQAERTIRVTLVRARPRPTVYGIGPPYLVLPLTYQQATIIEGPLVRVRPRHTVYRLSPPTTLRVFAGPVETEVTVRTPLEDRRRAPRSRLSPPTTLREFFGPAETEVTVRIPLENKRRPARYHLFPPAVIRIPAVEQALRTIRVTPTRTRPRPTRTTLRPPTVLRVFQAAKITLARTRPRPTTRRLAPPTIVRVPNVEQALRTIRVTLAGRTRSEALYRIPRSRLLPPTVVAAARTFVAARITVATIRPHLPHSRLAPPTVVAAPAPPTPPFAPTKTTLVAVQARTNLLRLRPFFALPTPPTPGRRPVQQGGSGLYARRHGLPLIPEGVGAPLNEGAVLYTIIRPPGEDATAPLSEVAPELLEPTVLIPDAASEENIGDTVAALFNDEDDLADLLAALYDEDDDIF